MHSGVLVGLAWVVILAIAFPIVRWWRKDTKQKKGAEQERQAYLRELGQRQGVVPLSDIFQLGQGNQPLPPGFSPAWYAVMRGEALSYLKPFGPGYLIQHRNWQFLVAESVDVHYFRGKRPMTDWEVKVHQATQETRQVTDAVELGVELLELATGRDTGSGPHSDHQSVRREAFPSTYVLALLPLTVATTQIDGIPRQETDPDALKLGFAAVSTGYPPFDDRFTITSKDAGFVRAAFGRPFFDHLLTAWQYGSHGSVVMRANVFKMDAGTALDPARFMPVVEHMATTLDRMNPQLWP